MKIRHVCFITFLLISFNVTHSQSNDQAVDMINQLEIEQNDLARLNIMIDLSEFYRQVNFQEAIRYGKMAVELAAKINDDRALARANLQLCEALYSAHQLDSIDAILIVTEPLTLKLKDTLLIAQAYAIKGSLAGRRKSFQIALDYLRKSLAMNLAIGNTKGVATIGNKIGIQYYQMRNYDSSLYYSLDARRNFLTVNDSTGYAMTSNNIGKIFFDEKEYQKAEKYFQSALEVFQSHKMDRFSANAYNNLGMINLRLSIFDQALYYFDKCIELTKKINYLSEMANAHTNKGAVYDMQMKYSKAIEEHLRALSLFEQIGNKNGIIQCHSNLALMYERSGNYTKALSIYDTCLILLKETPNPNNYLSIHFNIYRTHALAGNFKKAYEYQEYYQGLKDSIFNLEKFALIAELEQKYEKEQDESKILALNNEALLKEIALKNRTSERNISIFLTLILLITALFVFIFYRQKMKRIRLLKEKEIQKLEEEKKVLAARALIEGQEEERKRVAQELHDGIGVLLSSVKLQFTRIEDQQPENAHLVKQARNMLDKAAGDIRRISHNIMPGNLIRYGLDAAVEDLFESINESGLIKAEAKIQSGETKLSENFQIMVYRIIQEMVNNTLKHADAKNISLVMNYNANFSLQYADNGKGFSPEEVIDGPTLGIKSISSRVNFMEGEMNIESSPGKGTSVFITIPSIKK